MRRNGFLVVWLDDVECSELLKRSGLVVHAKGWNPTA
jgi:hypothetical protein